MPNIALRRISDLDHFWSQKSPTCAKTFLRESGRREKAKVLEIVGYWCESLHVCVRFFKIVEEES